MPERRFAVVCLALFVCLLTGCGGGGGGAPTSNTPQQPPPSPTVVVSVTPASASVVAGGTQQFTAMVTGTTNTAVTWTVNGITGGNSTAGTISASGLYTAPASVPSSSAVTVAAVSAADTSKSASASVTVTSPVTVSLSPRTASVQTGKSQQFVAAVSGTTNTAVTWSVNGVVGGNSTYGTITGGTYVAPSSVPAGPVTITATSLSNSAKSASAAVTITSEPVVSSVAITVAPLVASIEVGATQQFSATVTGTPNTAVTWSVNGIAGGNSDFGTISAQGVYKAPSDVPTANPVTITASSVADTSKSASATVTVKPPPEVVVAVTPASASLKVEQSQQFTATVSGSTNTAVTWSVAGVAGGNLTVGTITDGGLYTAPLTVPAQNPVTITAVSVANPKKWASATLTLAPPDPPPAKPVSVTVAPVSALVQLGKAQRFAATVVNTTNTAVTWTVNSVVGGDDVLGWISIDGVYTAPKLMPPSSTVTVAATSVEDANASGTAAVTLLAPPAPSGAWHVLGPAGVQITSLVQDPHTPETLYAAGSNVLYKSSDSGENWEEIVQAGVGTPLQMTNDGTLFSGIYKSIDDTRTWTQLPSIPVGSTLLRVASSDPAAMYAAVPNPIDFTTSIYRSTNGGQSWTAGAAISGSSTQMAYPHAVVVDPADASKLYVGTNHGVMLSTNSGRTYSNPLSWAVDTRAMRYVSEIAVDPRQTTNLFAAANTTLDGKLYRSTDGGLNWTDITGKLNASTARIRGIGFGANATVYVAVGEPSGTQHAGANGIYASQDNGETWQRLDGTSALEMTSSVEMIVTDSAPVRLLIATGEVFKTSTDGTALTRAMQGIANSRISDIALPSESLIYALGEGVLYKSADRGATWATLATDLAGARLGVNPADVNHVVVPGQCSVSSTQVNGIRQSHDGGATWTCTSLPIQGVLAIEAIEFGANGAILLADSHGVLRSTDGGTSWSFANSGLTDTRVHGLAANPKDRKEIYAATSSGVYKSADSGTTWSALAIETTGTKVFAGVYVNPANPTIVFAVNANNSLYRTDDSGTTWSAVIGVVARSVAFDPQDPALIYVNSSISDPAPIPRVLVSTDGGTTWTKLEAEEPGSVVINKLVVAQGALYAATDGKGVLAFH